MVEAKPNRDRVMTPGRTDYMRNAGQNILNKTVQKNNYSLRGNRWAQQMQKGKNYAKGQSPDFEETKAWEEMMKHQVHSRSPEP